MSATPAPPSVMVPSSAGLPKNSLLEAPSCLGTDSPSVDFVQLLNSTTSTLQGMLLLLGGMDTHTHTQHAASVGVAVTNDPYSDPADPSQMLKTHLRDVPSDLALHQYKTQTTYAKLEDVLNSRRPSTIDQPTGISRRDSHQIQPVIVTDDQQTEPSSGDDNDEGLEINFKRSRPLRESASEPMPDSGFNSDEALLRVPHNTARLSVEDATNLVSTSLTRAATHPFDQVSEQQMAYPPIPPEPQLQPVPQGDDLEPPQLALDSIERPWKHHIRGRTFPLRMRPTHGHHPQLSIPLQTETENPSSTELTETRYRGFSAVGGPKPELTHGHPPLHLQPHPGHARPLPPTHPRSHFAPNPAPPALPLPRRQSNPPPPVDPAQDRFYHELKSKLWKLAQELEQRQPQRVTIPEDVEMPSPDIEWDDELEYDFESDEEDPFSAGSKQPEIRWTRSGDFGQWTESPTVTMDQSTDTSRRNSDKMEEAAARMSRRASESKGRRRARERSEVARLNWLRGPD